MTNLKSDIVPPLSLRAGAGGDYANGLCVMEAVAWMASEGATDHPECACPVLAAFAIRLNDSLSDENRQQLKPLILPLTGTRSKEHERKRADFLVLAVANRILPQVFEARWPEHAKALREAKTLEEVRIAAANAAATATAATAIYAAAAANAAATAATAAAANAATATIAYATTYAANAASQKILLQCIPILREAIMLGPNASDQWETYESRAQALAEFLMGAM